MYNILSHTRTTRKKRVSLLILLIHVLSQLVEMLITPRI